MSRIIAAGLFVLAIILICVAAIAGAFAVI